VKKGGLVNHREEGALILERIASAKPPAALGVHTKAFKKAHDAFESAAKKADATKATRDAALTAIADADSLLDDEVLALANDMVTAELGTRTKPFGRFTTLSPSKIVEQAYRVEIATVRDLAKKISASKPAPNVAKRITSMLAAAKRVESALDATAAPELGAQRAMASRDSLLVDWTRALGVLKKNAAAVWASDPATYRAIFAAHEARPKPTKMRAKKAAPAAAPAK
jgi:hypothetical protein